MNINENPSFTIIFVESALEPVKKLNKKSQIKKRKSLERTLLDASLHSHLIQNLPDKNKRGRPDIIHNALLLALGSRLNKEKYLEIYVHTINNEVIAVNPEVRIPRNYNRFVGLMEQLFEVRNIPPNSSQTLISITSQSLEDLLNTLKPNRVVLFVEGASPINRKDLQNLFLKNKKIVILIGAFPHGNLSQRILELPNLKLSIYPEPLDTLVVLSYVIQVAEESLKFDE